MPGSWWKRLPPVHILLIWGFLVIGLTVNFLQLLTLLVWPFSRWLYRKLNSWLAFQIWCQFTMLSQWYANSKIRMFVRPEQVPHLGTEHSIVIMNHRYETDWMLGWCAVERLGMLGSSKMVGKKVLKFIPIIGWSFYFTECMFLSRNLDHDRRVLEYHSKEMISYPKEHPVSVLFFPEGTRFTEAKLAACNEVAAAKGLSPMRHLLLPRTRGFILLLQSLKGRASCIYDMTLAVPAGEDPTMMAALNGRPCRADFLCERIPLDDVPSDDAECSKWLFDLYKKKDDALDYYFKHGQFPDQAATDMHLARRNKDITAYLIWLAWSILVFAVFVLPYIVQSKLNCCLFVLLLVFMSYGARKLIGVTEIRKSSSYGLGGGASSASPEGVSQGSSSKKAR
uniref:PlsC domain-containing protein n=1 Tax=Macrostomum lignano TaxID=282301 RepID=A0A1I8H886_9PLAT